jgi:NAD(P)H-nitrite reductase large subunit
MRFGGLPPAATPKVLGIEVYSIGAFDRTEGVTRLEGELADKWYQLIFADGLLVGANVIGDSLLTAHVKKAVENRIDLSALLQKMPSLAMALDRLRGI